MREDIDAIVQLSFVVQQALGEVAAAHDLSLTQLRLLGILRDREPSMLDLARLLDLGKSSVTGLIDRAQRRGLVKRTAAAHDGRGVHVRLTHEGRRLAAQGEQDVYARIDALLAGVPARDRTRLAALAASVFA